MPKFAVYGDIKLRVSTFIEADSEEQAMNEVKENFKDYYHLEVIGSDLDKYSMDLDIEEYD